MAQPHPSTYDAISCVHAHLAALVERLRTPEAVCEAFNIQPARLFELHYDEDFGVWLLRPAL